MRASEPEKGRERGGPSGGSVRLSAGEQRGKEEPPHFYISRDDAKAVRIGNRTCYKGNGRVVGKASLLKIVSSVFEGCIPDSMGPKANMSTGRRPPLMSHNQLEVVRRFLDARA